MSRAIENISIIGSGNVAFHIGKALSGQIKVNSICSRNLNTGKELANQLNARHYESVEEISSSDLILVCVNDDEISDVIQSLPDSQPIAYTSGTVSLAELPERRFGGFLPSTNFFKR